MANRSNQRVEQTELQQIQNGASSHREDDENLSRNQPQLLMSSTLSSPAAALSTTLTMPAGQPENSSLQQPDSNVPSGPPPPYEEIYPVQPPYVWTTNTSFSYQKPWSLPTLTTSAVFPDGSYQTSASIAGGQTVTSITNPYSLPSCPVHPRTECHQVHNARQHAVRMQSPFNSRPRPPRRFAPPPPPRVHMIGGQLTRPAPISMVAKWFFSTITLMMISSIICALLYVIIITINFK